MKFMLDTNIVSYFIKGGNPRLQQRIVSGLTDETICISAITRAELGYGIALMEGQAKRRAAVQLFINEIPTLSWTHDAADHYGRVAAALTRNGTPIGALDTQIAAHSLALELTLITHNIKHFKLVDGLRYEDWMAD